MNIVVPTVLLVLLAAGPVTAGEQDFILVNRQGSRSMSCISDRLEPMTGRRMCCRWILCRMGRKSKSISAPDEEADYWNIRVVDGEGDAIDWPEVNLTEISTIVLSFEDGLPVARYE